MAGINVLFRILFVFVAFLQSKAQIFLKTPKIEVGISEYGSIGTDASVPDDYSVSEFQSTVPFPWGNGLGISAKLSGSSWNATVENPSFCGDYVVPGSAEEKFSIKYSKGSTTTLVNTDMTLSKTSSSKVSRDGDDIQAASFSYSDGVFLALNQVLSFKSGGNMITGRVRITNLDISNSMDDIKYMRSILPSQGIPWKNDASTQNFVEYNPRYSGDSTNRQNRATPGLGVVYGNINDDEDYENCRFAVGLVTQQGRVNHFGTNNENPSELWTKSTWESYFEFNPRIANEMLNVGVMYDEILPMSSISFGFNYIFGSKEAGDLIIDANLLRIVYPTDIMGGSTGRVGIMVSPSLNFQVKANLGGLKIYIGKVGAAPSLSYDCKNCRRTNTLNGGYVFTKTLSFSSLSNGEYYVRVYYGDYYDVTTLPVYNTGPAISFKYPNVGTSNGVADLSYDTTNKIEIQGGSPKTVAFFRIYEDDGIIVSEKIGIDTSSPFGLDYVYTDLPQGLTVYLQALATDSSDRVGVAVLQVETTEKNVAPSDISISSSYVYENRYTNSYVASISTVDANGKDVHTYTLISSPGSHFKVSGSSLLTNVRCNYEAEKTETVTIRTTDPYGLYYEKTFTLTVKNTNDWPYDITLNGDEVYENVATGTMVGNFTAWDQDPNDTHTFTLNSGSKFKISGNKLLTNGYLDHEQASSYSISVTVRDQYGAYRHESFTINVLDRNEDPYWLELHDGVEYQRSPSVPENSLVGTPIERVRCKDYDSYDTEASLEVTMSKDGDGFFTVLNPLETIKTFAVAKEGLDYEAKDQYSIEFKCCDTGGRCRTHPYTVQVTDVAEPPTASSIAFTLPENSLKDTFIGVVPAKAEGPKVQLNFEIISGNEEMMFSINGCAGSLFVNQTGLNFERTNDEDERIAPEYNLLVEVKTAMKVNVWANITLTDVNEAPFIDDREVSFDENTPANTVITGQFSPSVDLGIGPIDEDDGDSHIFSIGEGNTLSAFEIDPLLGTLTLIKDIFDYESPIKEYNVVVVCTDAEGLTDEANVKVTVLDINEPPILPSGSLTASIAELQSDLSLLEVGTEIGQYEADDEDEGQVITYTISDCPAFVIDDTGTVTVSDPSLIDYEVKSSHVCMLKATDNGSPILFDEKTLTVTITDVPEKPELTENPIIVNVDENQPIGELIIDISDYATDPDYVGDEKPKLTYKVDDWQFGEDIGDAENVFSLHELQGTLTVAQARLDFETVNQFKLQVRVADVLSLYVQAEVIINVLDVNEAPVMAFSEPTRRGFLEDADINSLALFVDSELNLQVNTEPLCAEDPDDPEFFWSITAGDDDNVFELEPVVDNEQCVNIKLIKDNGIDYEAKKQHDLEITATDRNDASLFESVTVNVLIFNVNEAPTIIQPNPVLSVTELALKGDSIGSPLFADDPDENDSWVWTVITSPTDEAISLQSNGQFIVETEETFEFKANTFTFTVRVTDAGGLYHEDDVMIKVQRTNKPPKVTAATILIPEDESTNSVFGHVEATDPDEGDTLSYSILSGNVDSTFYINPTTADLTLMKSLDFETKTQYVLLVQAKDNGEGTMTANAEITIDVTDVNEHPVCDSFTFSVPENSEVETEIGTVTASDVDAGSVLRFSIVKSIDDDDTTIPFSIDAISGLITVSNDVLDFETQATYSVTIRVTDNGGLTNDAITTIQLTDENDAPILTAHSFSVNENTKDGTFLSGAVECTDQDPKDSHRYSMIQDNCWHHTFAADSTDITSYYYFPPEMSPTAEGEWRVLLDIKGTFAQIALSETTDDSQPAHQIVIGSGLDGNVISIVPCPDTCDEVSETLTMPALSSKLTSTYWIQVLKNGDGTSTIRIGSGSQFTINTIKEVTNAPTKEFRYVGVRGAFGKAVDFRSVCLQPSTANTESSMFAMNENGDVSVSKSDETTELDYETLTLYSFKVQVSDGKATDISVVEVEVLNINEAPTFDNLCSDTETDFCYSVFELSEPTTVVGAISASDPDDGTWGKLSYSIISGNIGSAFTVNAATGMITVAKNILDFEGGSGGSEYQLLVVAADEVGLSDTATVRISILDVNEAPYLPSNALLRIFSIAENTNLDTKVDQVSGSDVDDSASSWGQLTYSITKQWKSADETNSSVDTFRMEIDGTIFTNGEINFEESDQYTLLVRATDGGDLYGEAEYWIDIEDVNESPVLEDFTIEIFENSIVNSFAGFYSETTNTITAVPVPANDPDVGQALFFTFVPDAADNVFKINDCSGQVSVALAVLDYEVTDTYTFDVNVEDDGGLSDDGVLTIKIRDVNEAPECTDSIRYIDENSEIDSAVGDGIDGYDQDFDDEFTFSIISGDDNHVFAVDTLPSEVDRHRLGQIKVNGTVDYEDMSVLTLEVQVEDKEGLTGTCTVTVYVNDINEAPIFEDASVSTLENLANGASVGNNLQATDVDTGDQLKFTLDDDDNGTFTIDSDGQLRQNIANLNFELHETHTVIARATDKKGLYDTATITVKVTDVNEQPNLTSVEFFVDENSSFGSEVGVLTATDPEVDYGTAQSLIYILSVNPGNIFKIEQSSEDNLYRLVVLSETLDYETKSEHSLKITVQDTGIPKQSDIDVPVTIGILNINEPPTCQSAERSVAENSSGNTSVGEALTYDDVDLGDKTTITFSIMEEGEHYSDFVIDNDGFITVADTAALDYESYDVVDLTVKVTDTGSLSGTCAVTIKITDLNERPTLLDTSANMLMNAENDLFITSSTATDPDSEDNLVFSIESGNDDKIFAIDTLSGAITVNDNTKIVQCPTGQTEGICHTYTLNVAVRDKGDLDGQAVYTINVLPFNYPPVFKNDDGEVVTEIQVSVDENSAFESDVQALKCSDENGEAVTFSIDVSPLAINPTTGMLTVLSPLELDFETTSAFETTVYCKDANGVSTFAKLKIKVNDVNEAPVIHTFGGSIDENSFASTPITMNGSELNVAGSDQDGDELSYSLAMADGSTLLFELPSTGGSITLKNSDTLDFETKSSYNLIVTVDDNNGLTDTAAVTITINDINEVPVFNPAEIMFIDENSAEGTVVGTVTASDQDNKDLLTFSLVGSSGNAFLIDPNYGTIKVQYPDSVDYEIKPEYTLTCRVTDRDGLYADMDVTVKLNDVNDVHIDSITINGASNADILMQTAGDEVITIRGTNLGDQCDDGCTDLAVKVTYERSLGVVFTAKDCEITIPYYEIECKTVPGDGDSLFWTITIIGKYPDSERNHSYSTEGLFESSYAPPVITAVEGSAGIATAGGSTITIRGDNFSEGIISPIALSYNIDETRENPYLADCTVMVSHTEVECVTPSGVGKIFSMTLTVGSLDCTYLDENGHYDVPTITSFANNHLFDTSGNSFLTIDGTSFGIDSSDAITATFGPESEPDRYTVDCELEVADSQVICDNLIGVGANHKWRLHIAGQVSEFSSETTSFLPPSISQISGMGSESAITDGGQRIDISAQQVGPIGTIPIVKYGFVIEDENDENGWHFEREFTAVECKVTQAHKIIYCLTGEGVGFDLSWQIEVDGQKSNLLEAKTSYGAPVIENYEGEGATDADTKGNEIVTILGKNFGSVEHNAIDGVIYSRNSDLQKSEDGEESEGEIITFEALNCNVIEDHSKIQCTTTEGAGKELSWIVTIARQESSAPTTDYHIPEIFSIEGDGSLDADTDGGEEIRIVGDNFGPSPGEGKPTFLESVTYGASGNDFIANNCVVETHQLVTCTTVPGYGNELKWLMSVASQTSEMNDDLITNYGDPTISLVEPHKEDDVLHAVGPTTGGVEIKLMGYNYALKHPDAKQYIRWTMDDKETSNLPDMTKVDPDEPKATKHTLSFILPESDGYDIPIIIHVGQDAINGRQSTQDVKLSYYPPDISGLNIQDSTQDASMVIVEVQGSNLSTRGIVLVNDVEIDVNRISVHRHDQITFEYFGRSGIVKVVIGGQTSKGAEFLQQSPILFGKEDDEHNIYVSQTKFRTIGGEVLTLEGARFGDVSNEFEITVNDKECVIDLSSHHPENPQDGEKEYISCAMPEGQGIKQKVIVKRVMQTSQNDMFIDYARPTVSEIRLCSSNDKETCIPCSREVCNPSDPTDCTTYLKEVCRPNTEGSYFYITGDNFGVDPLIFIQFDDGSTMTLDYEILTPHTELMATVKSYEGVGKLQIYVADQGLIEDEVRTIKYAGPIVNEISPNNAPTTGYADIIISGMNFGVKGFTEIIEDNNVQIGDYFCTVSSFTATEIHCSLPMGVGKELPVSILVADEESQEVILFSYRPPVVQVINPPSAPTSGIIAETEDDPIILEITGLNFGNSTNTGSLYFKEWRSDDDEIVLPEIAIPLQAIKSWSHDYISVLCPVGVGSGRELIVTVGDSESNKQSTEYQTTGNIFDYNPPEVTSFLPLSADTSGGTIITFEGISFGLATTNYNYVRISLDDEFCDPDECILSENHDEIQWMCPPGFGVDKELMIFVGNQGIAESIKFSYSPPYIKFVSPARPNAQGGSETHKLTIFGNNFGNVATNTTVLIDGIDCEEAQWTPFGVGADPVAECIIPEGTVGPKQIELWIADQYTLVEASTNKLTYICYEGAFGQPKLILDEEIMVPNEGSDFCMTCPEGASCKGYDFGIEYEPIAEYGSWVTNFTCEEHYPVNATTREWCPVAVGCLPDEACCGENTCCYGYQDEKCVNCLRGEYYRRNGRCVECPGYGILLVLGFIAAAIGLCIGGYYMNKKNVHLAFLAIGVDYFQVLAMFASSDVEWPSTIRTILDYMSVFQFNLDISAPECTMPDFGFAMKFIFVMMLPVAALAMFLLLHFWKVFQKRCIKGRKNKLNAHLPALIGTSLTMFYFLYIYLTRVSLDVFNCNAAEPSDGYTYMEASPSIKCGSALHTNLVLGAIVSTIVYSFGYPAIVAFVLFKYKDRVREDQLLRAMKTGDNRLTNANCYNFRKTFHKIYYHFKPDKFYWNLLIIARKFVIAFAALMFRNNPAFQLAVALLVMFFAYALQVRHNPYMCPKKFNKIIDEYEMRANTGDDYAKMLLTKARKSAKGSEGRHIRAKKDHVGVFVFDYNQVESVLLMSGTLVTLSGVMFQSQYLESSDYDVQRETLTMIVLIIILASILYYCLVFVTEIWGTCRAHNKKRTLTKREKVEEALQVMKDFELKQDMGEGGALAMNPMFAAQREILEKAADPKAALLSNESAARLKEISNENKQLLLNNKSLKRQVARLEDMLAGLDTSQSVTVANPAINCDNSANKPDTMNPMHPHMINNNNNGLRSSPGMARREKLLGRSPMTTRRKQQMAEVKQRQQRVQQPVMMIPQMNNNATQQVSPKSSPMVSSMNGKPALPTGPKKQAKQVMKKKCDNGGWTKHMDDEYGIPYYYNASTGASTYDKPPEFTE